MKSPAGGGRAALPRLLFLQKTENSPGTQFPAFSSILGTLWGRAAGSRTGSGLLSALEVSLSSLVSCLGSTRGSRRRLVAFLARVGSGYIALMKKNKRFLKWWLSQRGLLGFILIPKIVGWVLALPSSSLHGGNWS